MKASPPDPPPPGSNNANQNQRQQQRQPPGSNPNNNNNIPAPSRPSSSSSAAPVAAADPIAISTVTNASSNSSSSSIIRSSSGNSNLPSINNNVKVIISLRDVQEEFPFESEEESRIMEDLEITDPTTPYNNNITTTTISTTTTPAAAAATANNNNDHHHLPTLLEEQVSLILPPPQETLLSEHDLIINSNNQNLPSSQQHININTTNNNNKPRSVEEQLCAATNAINKLHIQNAQAVAAGSVPPPPGRGGGGGIVSGTTPTSVETTPTTFATTTTTTTGGIPADIPLPPPPPPPGSIYRGGTTTTTTSPIIGGNNNNGTTTVPTTTTTTQIFDEEVQGTNFDEFAANAGKVFHTFQKSKHNNPKKSNNNNNRRGSSNGSKKRSSVHTNNTTTTNTRTSHQTVLIKNFFEPNFDVLREFREIILSDRKSAWKYISVRLCYVIIPLTGLACLLFYVFENPAIKSADPPDGGDGGTGSDTNSTRNPLFLDSPTPAPGDEVEEDATVSWLILFFGVRQVLTFMIAAGLQFLLVACATKLSYKYMGPVRRLIILQSQGFPMQLIFWCTINFAILQGEGAFIKHWLYFQNFIHVFNANNPAGTVTESRRYFMVLLFGIVTGVAVSLKRCILGLKFETQSYSRYSRKLSKTLKQIVLVGEVSKSAHYENTEGDSILVSLLDDYFLRRDHHNNYNRQSHNAAVSSSSSATTGGGTTSKRSAGASKSNCTDDDDDDDDDIDVDDRATPDGVGLTGSESNQTKINQLLGEWEELDILDQRVEKPALSSIVQFRSSVSVLKSDYPFSPYFGRASTREQVVEGSQRLYLHLLAKQEKLQLSKPGCDDSYTPALLHFHTVALAALNPKDQSVDDQLIKDLIRLLRPGRDGNITLLEFCKSVDSLYKKMRKLRASLVSEGRVNAAAERLTNACFYFVLSLIWLAVIGIDPVVLIGMFASILISLSFMIGAAAADYFRGLLLVLVQKPYDIGDRINVNNAENDSPASGAMGWIVKDVTLYHTTVVFALTQEYATISNGALSKSRIINCARSPRAMMFFLAKFGIGVSLETITKYKQRLIEYVKSKPREWLAFNSFRMTRMEADLGFVEYKVMMTHRESWQQNPALLSSLADVQAFGFKLVQELNMGYKSPSLPVEMRLSSRNMLQMGELKQIPNYHMVSGAGGGDGDDSGGENYYEEGGD